MDTTPSSSLTRYRPVVLAITGFAAAYGAFLVYKSLQVDYTVPTVGVRRSNAIHRRRSPRASQPQANAQEDGARDRRSSAEQTLDFDAIDDYGRFLIIPGVEIELRPSTVRSLTAQSLQDEHGFTQLQAQEVLFRLHHAFVARFDTMHFEQREHRATSEDDRARLHADLLVAMTWLRELGIGEEVLNRGLGRPLSRPGEDNDHGSSIAGTEVDMDLGVGQRNGLNLKQLLYHIAENQAHADGSLHRGFRCDSCGASPIRGTRWKCSNCSDLDLCTDCHATCMHARNHIFYEVKIPTYGMNHRHPIQEIAYLGRIDVSRTPPLSPDLCRRLVESSNMEKAEVEELYEQFVCLASAPHKDGAVGYAIDRTLFPYIVSPLSSRSLLRVNLIFDRLFDLFDTNRDNHISFEEFLLGVHFLRDRSNRKHRWRKTFEAYDLDGDGIVTRSDCLRMFRALWQIQKDLTMDLMGHNQAVNGLRDATGFAMSGRVISAAFNQNPRTVPDPRAPLNKSRNGYGESRYQPQREVILPNNDPQADRDEIIGNAWESQAQFPFDPRTGEPLSLKDCLYLAPRDSLGRAPTKIARDQRVHFSYDGKPLSEARDNAVEEREKRRNFYDAADPEPHGRIQVDGYDIPAPDLDLTRDLAYAVMENAMNELLDPLFQAKEDLHMEALSAEDEINQHVAEIQSYLQRKEQERKEHERATADPLMAVATATEEAARLQEIELERQGTEEARANGHPLAPRVPVNMADAITSVEQEVQAQPLAELLDSQGFGVREGVAAGTTSASDDNAFQGAHLEIGPRPTAPNIGLDPPRNMITGTSVLTAAPPGSYTNTTVPRYDPTMPQFRPNSERDVRDALAQNITVDPMIRPHAVTAAEVDEEPEDTKHRPRFEAEIIRQFEYMFLGWDRDPATGVVQNSTSRSNGKITLPKEKLPISGERLARLVELKKHLDEQKEREAIGLDLQEFEKFLDSAVGTDFRFLEGWLEVCYF